MGTCLSTKSYKTAVKTILQAKSGNYNAWFKKLCTPHFKKY